jgi:hypothetical protein
MNKLHEFSTGAYETFDGIESVVEEVLGRIGCLNRNAWIVDDTVDGFGRSVLRDMAQKYEMKTTADAGAVHEGAIACVVASSPCVVRPPLMVLSGGTVPSSEYVNIYQEGDVRVFVRRDLARRVGIKTMEMVGKKNETSDE